MNSLQVVIESVQHIRSMRFEIDLTRPRLVCLVGPNGVGKTTLVRALANLVSANTFVRTAPPRIFSGASRISYLVDNESIVFSYDSRLRTLNSRDNIPAAVREAISVELPIPHGARFNFAKSASEADDEIRSNLALGTAERPEELIEFLSSIYQSERYEALVAVNAKGQKFYAIAQPDGTYIREDYLSSGEHFLINLYRAIKSPARLIVIDEIDLSLDSAAQARLSHYLRNFCARYGCTILFTTHSLAIMRTLDATELLYFENLGGNADTTPASYSYAKARLFGFAGWDRYILTEDKVLLAFIEFLIRAKCAPTFFSWKVIYIGGGAQVADLLARNRADGFLARSEEVIAILDGDRQGQTYASWPDVFLLPLANFETAFYALRESDPVFPFVTDRLTFTSAKDFFIYVQQTHIATAAEIFEYVYSSFEQEFAPLLDTLAQFLAYPDGGQGQFGVMTPAGDSQPQ